jgi:NAD(P)-dependent dehydrogenase (short-subunit alcohol dehydrogenase family)
MMLIFCKLKHHIRRANMNGNVIIMGANGGAGEKLALRLSGAGYDVYATVRDSWRVSPELKDHAKAIFQVDAMDPSSMEEAFSFFSENNPVMGFAYCIGTIDLQPLKVTTDDAFFRAFEINVVGAVRALRMLEKPIKDGRGSVVLFSSIAAEQGFTNHTVIGSAKGAIEGFAKSLAAEWAGQARVNVIAPSLTDTPVAKALTSSQPMREAIEKMHPIPRLGTPDDLAAAAQFLIGPDSGWITGQILRIDGGRSTLRPRG